MYYSQCGIGISIACPETFLCSFFPFSSTKVGYTWSYCNKESKVPLEQELKREKKSKWIEGKMRVWLVMAIVPVPVFFLANVLNNAQTFFFIDDGCEGRTLLEKWLEASWSWRITIISLYTSKVMGKRTNIFLLWIPHWSRLHGTITNPIEGTQRQNTYLKCVCRPLLYTDKLHTIIVCRVQRRRSSSNFRKFYHKVHEYNNLVDVRARIHQPSLAQCISEIMRTYSLLDLLPYIFWNASPFQNNTLFAYTLMRLFSYTVIFMLNSNIRRCTWCWAWVPCNTLNTSQLVLSADSLPGLRFLTCSSSSGSHFFAQLKSLSQSLTPFPFSLSLWHSYGGDGQV